MNETPENPQNPQGVELTVLEQIKQDKLRMKPRSYFVCKAVLLIVLMVLVLTISAFVLSYIYFSLKTSGELFLLGFGKQGVEAFFLLFPWAILLVDLLLLILLDHLIRQYRFGYRLPVAYLLCATILLALFTGTLVNETSFHQYMMREAREQRLPMIGTFYNGLRQQMPQEGVYSGLVVRVGTSTFLLQNGSSTEFIFVSPGTDLPERFSATDTDDQLSAFMRDGDDVFVAGTLVGGQIRAYGVSEINETQ